MQIKCLENEWYRYPSIDIEKDCEWNYSTIQLDGSFTIAMLEETVKFMKEMVKEKEESNAR